MSATDTVATPGLMSRAATAIAANAAPVFGRLAAALVAVVAGAASFEHIAQVAKRAGEQNWIAYSLPLAIDGLIVVGVAALVEDKRQKRRGRWSGRLAVVIGVLGTLAANIDSAQPTMRARLVAVAAPIAFLVAVEVLTRIGRPITGQRRWWSRQEPAPAAPARSAVPDALMFLIAHEMATRTHRALPPAPATPRRRTPAKPATATDLHLAPGNVSEPDTTQGVPATVDMPANGNGHKNGQVTAADIMALQRQHPDWVQDQVARELGTSTRTLRRVLQRAALTGDTGTEGDTT